MVIVMSPTNGLRMLSWAHGLANSAQHRNRESYPQCVKRVSMHLGSIGLLQLVSAEHRRSLRSS
jgi:hypothetical protein